MSLALHPGYEPHNKRGDASGSEELACLGYGAVDVYAAAGILDDHDLEAFALCILSGIAHSPAHQTTRGRFSAPWLVTLDQATSYGKHRLRSS